MSSRFVPGTSLRHQHIHQHDIINQSINQFTFPVCRTHQRSQQTITGEVLRMLNLIERKSLLEVTLASYGLAFSSRKFLWAEVFVSRAGKQSSMVGLQEHCEDFMRDCIINCNAVHLARQASFRQASELTGHMPFRLTLSECMLVCAIAACLGRCSIHENPGHTPCYLGWQAPCLHVQPIEHCPLAQH